MKKKNSFIEVHQIKQYPPSAPNSGEFMEIKVITYGGCVRARNSSFSWKRSSKELFRNLVPEEMRAYATSNLAKEMAKRLADKFERDEEAAMGKSITLLNKLKVGSKPKDDYATSVVFYTTEEAKNRLTDIVQRNWDSLPLNKSDDAYKKISKTVLEEFETVIVTCVNEEIALYGRMLGNFPEASKDGACMVAHEVGTHAYHLTSDFWTAVEDWPSEYKKGVANMGHRDLSANCYYRCAALDLNQLYANLGEDKPRTRACALAFLQAIMLSGPTGQQNNTIPSTEPAFTALVSHHNTMPINLVNAFVRPISGEDVVSKSVKRLEQHFQEVDILYGSLREYKMSCSALNSIRLSYLNRHRLVSLADVLAEAKKRINVMVK